MRRIFSFIVLISVISALHLYGQSYDYANTTLANFLQRHYENEPFEGLREIEDYNTKYLEVVLTIESDENADSISDRLLYLKAARMISEYENGVRIIELSPISTKSSTKSKDSKTTVYSSSGITGKVSLLTVFLHKGKRVYIYIKKS